VVKRSDWTFARTMIVCEPLWALARKTPRLYFSDKQLLSSIPEKTKLHKGFGTICRVFVESQDRLVHSNSLHDRVGFLELCGPQTTSLSQDSREPDQSSFVAYGKLDHWPTHIPRDFEGSDFDESWECASGGFVSRYEI